MRDVETPRSPRPGWTASEKLWAKAGPRAFVALAEKHGFRPTPPSQLDGEDAALSFEKQTNTLAQRHRVRLWPRTETLARPARLAGLRRARGRPRVRQGRGHVPAPADPKMDAERDKVAQDLVFAGRVAARGLVDRKPSPRTAAADRLTTTAAWPCSS